MNQKQALKENVEICNGCDNITEKGVMYKNNHIYCPRCMEEVTAMTKRYKGIDYLFKDADKISQKYGCDISEVVIQFTLAGIEAKIQHKDDRYITLIHKVEEHYKELKV